MGPGASTRHCLLGIFQILNHGACESIQGPKWATQKADRPLGLLPARLRAPGGQEPSRVSGGGGQLASAWGSDRLCDSRPLVLGQVVVLLAAGIPHQV